jgi:hypothetical protein
MRLRPIFAVLLVTPACGGAIEIASDREDSGVAPDAASTDAPPAARDGNAPSDAVALDAAKGATQCYTLHDGGAGPCFGANGPGYETYEVFGDLSTCGFAGVGLQPSSVCKALCKPGNLWNCTWDPQKPNVVVCGYACGGRSTQGATTSSHVVYFAGMAELEAISVHAFRRLERELQLHDAPPRLRARCRTAARDEVRHARLMNRLAASRGATKQVVRMPCLASRSLADVALENAVEGCVHETWGALVGAWQAEHAQSQDVRTVMRTIARDELRHAELSWSIHSWAMNRLTETRRRGIQRAMRAAIDELRGNVANVPDALVREAGLPAGDRAATLFAGLEKRVWGVGRANQPG